MTGLDHGGRSFEVVIVCTCKTQTPQQTEIHRHNFCRFPC